MMTQTTEQGDPIALRVGEHLTRGPNELYALSPKPIPLGPRAGGGADVGRLVYRRDEATLDLLHNVSRNGMLAWGGGAVWAMLFFVGVFLFVSFGAVKGASSWFEALGIWGGSLWNISFLRRLAHYPRYNNSRYNYGAFSSPAPRSGLRGGASREKDLLAVP